MTTFLFQDWLSTKNMVFEECNGKLLYPVADVTVLTIFLQIDRFPCLLFSSSIEQGGFYKYIK